MLLLVPRLRRLREAVPLSQDELAHRAHVARTTIMRAEGGGLVRPLTVRKLARALRVPPSDLQEDVEP